MRLKELYIRNFRKIEELAIQFPPGLCVIVGENNAGKTAIIDALRFMLLSARDFDALRVNEDDFRSGTDFSPIEISCTFCEPSEDDEVHFHECLVDLGEGKFDIRLNARVEFNKSTRRANVKTWGGETEGGSLPPNLYDRIASIYLQPLRDPESGLRPGRHSQISRLIDCLTDDAEHIQFEEVVTEANEKIRELKPVKDACNDINLQMAKITGSKLAQTIDLIFSEPSFHRIIAGLQPEIEKLPFALNGLGYNNLIFTSATLGTLQESDQYSFRSILVEEPEAHLHPHLQTLLLRHLLTVSAEKGGNKVQVIVSSHSPVLVSQAPIDAIVSVHESDGKVSAVSMCSVEMDANPNKAIELKKKLQRFLDATRAELFFARRIVMVEGMAEALLLPVLTRIAGGCLKDSAVTVLNTDGINFNAFLPLFGEHKLRFRVAILTDGDAKKMADTSSATAKNLKDAEKLIPNLRVEMSSITFEHELARSATLLPFMLNAFENLHPNRGKRLKGDINQLESNDQKADAFLEAFLDSKTSKGCFAQELASLLDTEDLHADAVPAYIRSALAFLEVITVAP
jgi:putative ATP-dependent endonuclease of OLD family